MRHRKRKELRFDREDIENISHSEMDIPKYLAWCIPNCARTACAHLCLCGISGIRSVISESPWRPGDSEWGCGFGKPDRICMPVHRSAETCIAVQTKGESVEPSLPIYKRIIGLPGESVEIRDGEIYINNRKLNEKYETTAIADTGYCQ